LGMRGYTGLGYDRRDKYGFYEVPAPEALPLMAETLEIFRECTRALSEGTNTLDAGWADFGRHLLPVTARVLEPFYKNVDFRSGREEDLLRLRMLARELNGWLMTNDPSITHEKSSVPRKLQSATAIPRVSYNIKHMPPSSLTAAWWESEGLWFESPQQALEVYEIFLSPPAYLAGRNVILGNKPGAPPPPLAGWNAADRLLSPTLWLQFRHLPTC
jgi:hypothetical protein